MFKEIKKKPKTKGLFILDFVYFQNIFQPL